MVLICYEKILKSICIYTYEDDILWGDISYSHTDG